MILMFHILDIFPVHLICYSRNIDNIATVTGVCGGMIDLIKQKQFKVGHYIFRTIEPLYMYFAAAV